MCAASHIYPAAEKSNATSNCVALPARHDGGMNAKSASWPFRALGAVFAMMVTLLMCGPIAGLAHAAAAAPAGDAISIGDPDALGQLDLYVDPLCPYSGKMVRAKGDEIGKRIEAGTLRVNLRFVDFLDKYSASGTYDTRAIYATYAVADQARSSDVTWRFVQAIYSADQQPREKGATDLSNDQLADAANGVGAPAQAQDLIRAGLPIGVDPRAVAASNLAVLHQFPDPGVPLVVINGQPIDGESDWLAQIPG
jgi:protein-disulfide isomerase